MTIKVSIGAALAIWAALAAASSFAMDVDALKRREPLLEASQQEADVCAAITGMIVLAENDRKDISDDDKAMDKAKAQLWVIWATTLNNKTTDEYIATDLINNMQTLARLTDDTAVYYYPICETATQRLAKLVAGDGSGNSPTH